MSAEMLRRVVLVLALGICMGVAWAGSPVVRVLALFPGKAMLSIDGKNRLLSNHQRSPEGVQLLDASAERAIVQIQGEKRTLRPGGAVSSRYSRPTHREVRVIRNRRGAYAIEGRINGRTVHFLVDTGASGVALGEDEARRLGIPFELYGDPIRVNTASGVSDAYSILLDSVQVGDIKLRNVEGAVVMGDGPGKALLGMSFLNRLQFENQGNVMVLRQKF